MPKHSFLPKAYFLVYLLNLLNSPSFSCPQDQTDTLFQFKDLLFEELKKDNANPAVASLDSLESWNSSSSSCQWDRVSCSPQPALPQVTELNLSSLGLPHGVGVSSNVLSPLFSITTLMGLHISSNNIQGSISVDFGNLKNLEVLDLSKNNLSMEFPAEIANLVNISILLMRENKLTGDIPPRLFNLDKIKYLHLGRNQFHGITI